MVVTAVGSLGTLGRVSSQGRPLSTPRRGFLGLAGLGVAGVTALQLAPVAPVAPARAADVDGSDRIAFITDAHVDPENATTMARVRATVDALVELDPALLLHGGDVTEYGTEEEFTAWLELLPEPLRRRTHHVPGNHESRWDPSAYQTYDRAVGPRNSSVDAAGLHIVLLDPTWVQQEVAHPTEADLAWLTEDLRHAGTTPTLLVSHYPFGNGFYYLDNSEALFDVIENSPVVGHLSGHIHREDVRVVNGITQVVGVATKYEPGYYLLTRSGNDLDVTFQAVADPTAPDSETTSRDVTTIPLGPRSPRDQTLEPGNITLAVTGSTVRVEARIPARAAVRSVDAAVYRQDIWAGSGEDVWTPLTGDRLRAGSVDVSALAPGEHRMIVAVTGNDGSVWREVRPFRIAGFDPVWTEQLDGPVQSATVAVGDDVVLATAGGSVLRVGGGAAPQERWRLDVGPVWANLAVSADRGTIYAASADHQLTAIATADGTRRWQADLGAPVMSDPAVVDLAGTTAVVVAATDTLWAVDAADGTPLWQRELPAASCGRVAGDGARVILGVGDGNAYAFDAATGEHLWHTNQTDRSGSYQRLIYGPWDNTVTILTDELVLVSTVSQARALDVATGATVWERTASYIYCPPVVLDGDVVLVDERGGAVRLDATTGEERWQATTAPRVLNAGFAVHEGDGYLCGVGGELHRVDLATGHATVLGQTAPEVVLSTPSLIGDRQLVVATIEGTVRAFDVEQ